MLFFLLLAFGVIVYFQLEIRPTLYKGYNKSTGLVTGTLGPNRSINNISLVYEFKNGVATEKHSQNTFRGASVNELKNVVIGRSFPVIYKNGFWGFERILITPDDFKEFNLPYPDSLNYIRMLLGKPN